MPSMDRRGFLHWISTGALGTAAISAMGGDAFGASQPAGKSRPNVLLIITDDQGYGDLGCHGNPVLKTPHMDRLHGESVRFAQFCVSPVCSPTRACLMTGRYNYRTGVVDTYAGRSMMDPGETTLAEMLGAAGYRTGIFGKWHLGDAYPLRPVDRGFGDSLVHLGGGIAQPSDPEYFERKDTYFDPVLQENGVSRKFNGYCTDIFTEAAEAFMGGDQEAPFFAYVSYNAPHTPLQVPEEDAAPYRAAGLEESTALVYGMIANTDRNIGRLLDFLDATGRADNTVVIFMTDNGAQNLGGADRYNAGLRDWKGSVYEGGIRVPFFVRWPEGVDGGRDVNRLAAHIDIAPTLLDLCDAAPSAPPAFDGISLVPLLAGAPDQWPDRTLFFQWHRGDAPEAFRSSAVRGERWKLVNGEELYDLAEDPGESRNLAEEHPERVAAMRDQYEVWFADVNASRGYDPVRIRLGNVRENPVTLTRQDWRTAADWTADKTVGHWEVEVEAAGEYSVEVFFGPAEIPGVVYFKSGDTATEQAVAPGADTATLAPLALESGAQRLECWLEREGEHFGARYVRVRKF